MMIWVDIDSRGKSLLINPVHVSKKEKKNAIKSHEIPKYSHIISNPVRSQKK